MTLTIHIHLVPRFIISTRLQDLIVYTGTALPLMQELLLVIPLLVTQKQDDKFSFMN